MEAAPVDAAGAEKGKRTNSLAFAQTDCHTCAATGNQCDRRRPQCSTCLALGRRCGGFAMPLSWDSRRMWTENPSTAAEGVPDSAIMPAAGTVPPRGFRFVRTGSRLRKRRKARNEASASGPPEAATGEMFPGAAGEEQSMPGVSGAQTGDEFQLTGSGDTVPGHDIWDDFALFDSFVPNIFEATPFLDFGLQDPLPADLLPQTLPLPLPGTTGRAIELMPGEDLNHDPLLQPYAPMPLATPPRDPAMRGVDSTVSNSQVQPGLGLSPRDHEQLLEMYDSEFCVLPLTSDMPINPLRCQRQTSQGSSLLFHSILALCCQHLKGLTGSGSAEADEHRRKALQLLDGALPSRDVTVVGRNPRPDLPSRPNHGPRLPRVPGAVGAIEKERIGGAWVVHMAAVELVDEVVGERASFYHGSRLVYDRAYVHVLVDESQRKVLTPVQGFTRLMVVGIAKDVPVQSGADVVDVSS
ncbi:uncharacterized protein DSM5745_03250 [Aspergillus mulundensis]|uniref:Zn(2)-C6 fungal-type domain-containing protein n=1 Tax=Aspergillus mulundensis TaxID=1810919 RepID=A0A3D8SLD2_9EURO|nr:hypothetical protein DSM5745_03250 [Aspergillus mulundensis]RDW86608.1 hypothetical protein DSM5745_03250 [Aspergillus mulundensis]